jgi:hypothetical protein
MITRDIIVNGNWEYASDYMIQKVNDFSEIGVNVKKVDDLDIYFKRGLGSSLKDELPTKQHIFEFLFNRVEWKEERRDQLMKKLEETVEKDIFKILERFSCEMDRKKDARGE